MKGLAVALLATGVAAGCTGTDPSTMAGTRIQCRAANAYVSSFAGGGLVIACVRRGARLVPDRMSLAVRAAPTPRLRVARYRTRGTYPQVPVRRVSAALRAAILQDQRAYAPSARAQARTAPQPYVGTYRTAIDRRLVSASTVVVSALMPALKLYPGGNDGSFWISATVVARTGRRVEIADLFSSPRRALAAVTAAAKDAVLATDGCVRASREADRIIHDNQTDRGFDATRKNYRHFALTPRGLAIGFDIAQVSGPSCNKIAVLLPYSLVRPYLSRLGARLIAGVRPAVWRSAH